MKGQKTPYTVRIPADIKSWVKTLAEKHHRSINSEIIVLLESLKKGDSHASH